MDCSAVDNKNTCKENVCQCNGGYIPDKDACKPCKENEISVQNPESLTFSCVACPTGEFPANDRQHCVGMLNNFNFLGPRLKISLPGAKEAALHSGLEMGLNFLKSNARNL